MNKAVASVITPLLLKCYLKKFSQFVLPFRRLRAIVNRWYNVAVRGSVF